MKRLFFIFIFIIIILSGAYFYIRFVVLKAKDFEPDYSKSKSVADLRPAIIAKLQQLVKDASGGLYDLSIGKIDPHISDLSIDITDAVLSPDSSIIKNLDKSHTLPDDLFKISLSSLHIDGIHINNLLSKDHLSLKYILINAPAIEVYYQEKWYNKPIRLKNDSITVYKRIMKKMKSISIDTIEVSNGTFKMHTGDKNNTTSFNKLSFIMEDVLIDSATQFDTKRFLFAKKATLSAGNFYGRTSDGSHYYKCASLNISTAENKLTALNFELHPWLNQQQFEIHSNDAGEEYKLTIPNITLYGIDGTDINDVLSKRHLSLKHVWIKAPVVEVYQKEKRHSKQDPSNTGTTTIYQKITKKMSRISIDTFQVVNGTLISHTGAKNRINKLNQVSILMKDVLIDSSTQNDTKRFLFAKQATLSTKNFYGRTADNLYYFKCASINISTAEDKITASGFELHPRFNQQQFESRLRERKEMYNLIIPKITLHGISWSKLANQKNIVANEAVVSNGYCKVFLDRSLPFRHVKINNFPDQILMRMPVPISITGMLIRHCKLAYSEHNPGMDKTGTIYIDDMNGEVTNITNMPEQIKKQNLLVIKSSGLFMHKIPMTNGFVFDLSKYKTGNFTMDLNIGELDSAVLNPITEPMGEFMIKKGSIQKGIAHVTGDNFKATGKGELLYKNLYLIGLKKDKNKPSGIKKKSIISFLGNVFLIKNNNPEKGKEPRVVDFNLKRESKTTFFSLVWGSIYSGILKTIGLPQSFANKSY